jgi:transposase
MPGLRKHCLQRVEQGEADKLVEPLLDLIEQLSERLFGLEVRVGKLLQAQYGRRSETVSAAQLQLGLGQLEPPREDLAQLVLDEKPEPAPRPRPPKKRPLRQIPQSIPRRLILSEPRPAELFCADCQVDKQCIGSEYAEVLDFEPGGFFVERTERKKYACRSCQSGVVIGPGPDRVLDQAMPGPGLLAEVVVRKFSDACPLQRQSRIFTERFGMPLSPSTLGSWVGGTARLLEPLWRELISTTIGSAYLSLDDSPIRVLDRGHKNGVKRGHIWSLVTQSAVVYLYTPTWSGEPIRQLLREFGGVLQSDGYAGLDALYKQESGAPVRAGCLAHARRKFVQALEAGDARAAIPLVLFRKLYEVERRATEARADAAQRLKMRQQESAPLLMQLQKELHALRAQAPPKTPLGVALGYAHRQWETLTVFLRDGAVHIDNNHVERTLRPIAIGRKNWLFGGSDEGARWLAIHQTLIGTCLLVGIRDPWAYLRDILQKLSRGWPQSRLRELLPEPWLASHSKPA